MVKLKGKEKIEWVNLFIKKEVVMVKVFKVLIVVMLLVFCPIAHLAYAKEAKSPKKQPEDKRKVSEVKETEDFQGKLGIGLRLNTMGSGPILKYYLTNNLALQAIADLGDFTTYGLSGIYQLDKAFDAGRVPVYPYAGISYMMVKGPEATYTYYWCTAKYKTKGSGAEFFGGVLFDLKRATGVNLHATAEAIYSPMEVKSTGDISCGSYRGTYEVKADWSEFIIGGSLIYYFK